MDRVLDAAAELADLIESSEIELEEYDLEELDDFSRLQLRRHSPDIPGAQADLFVTTPCPSSRR